MAEQNTGVESRFAPGRRAALAIFDLDGTLVNTLEDLGGCCNRALDACGLAPHPIDSYRHFVGDGVDTLIRRILPAEAGEEAFERVRGLYTTYYQAGYLDASHPYAGMPQTLEKLKEAGVHLAVCSNKPHNVAVKMVETLYPGMFDMIFGKREGIPKKPDPTAVKEILNVQGISPSEAVYIGDSNVDVFTGHNAGLYAIGCAWGFRGEEELSQAGADAIVQTPAELCPLLLGEKG